MNQSDFDAIIGYMSLHAIPYVGELVVRRVAETDAETLQAVIEHLTSNNPNLKISSESTSHKRHILFFSYK